MSTLISNSDDELEALSPQQTKTLRKETAKRRAAKKLATVYLDDSERSEDADFKIETLKEIVSQLEANELCQIRSISNDDKRRVLATMEQLAMQVSEEHNHKAVFLVEIVGHAAVLYCPNDNSGTCIPLRTTLKANAWEKRPRKPRDNAGQIIR